MNRSATRTPKAVPSMVITGWRCRALVMSKVVAIRYGCPLARVLMMMVSNSFWFRKSHRIWLSDIDLRHVIEGGPSTTWTKCHVGTYSRTILASYVTTDNALVTDMPARVLDKTDTATGRPWPHSGPRRRVPVPHVKPGRGAEPRLFVDGCTNKQPAPGDLVVIGSHRAGLKKYRRGHKSGLGQLSGLLTPLQQPPRALHRYQPRQLIGFNPAHGRQHRFGGI